MSISIELFMVRAIFGNHHNSYEEVYMCGIVGIINTDRTKIDGSYIREAIRIQNERGNGLGGGFAAYGIYPGHKDNYAVHIMYQGGRHSEIIKIVDSILIYIYTTTVERG